MRVLVAIAAATLIFGTANAETECRKTDTATLIRLAALSVAAPQCWFMPISGRAAETRLRQLMASDMCLNSGAKALNDKFVDVAVQAYIEAARAEVESWGDNKCSKARAIKVP